LARLRVATAVLSTGFALVALTLVAPIYVTLPVVAFTLGLVVGAGLVVLGGAVYAVQRPAARRLVWPTGGSAVA